MGLLCGVTIFKEFFMKKYFGIMLSVIFSIIIMSTVSLASDTWVQEGNDWFCYSKTGGKVYGEWKVNEGHYYYLDDFTGAMVKNRIIENNGKKYFCGPDGMKATGWTMVPVDNGTDGFEYMYFNQLEGAANLGESNIINNKGAVKKYRFDEYTGYMLYGYLNESWDRAESPSMAAYYYGPKEDGSAYTGWIHVTDGEDPNYPGAESKWFYFYKGRKIHSTIRQIEGVRYAFDENGAMVTGWSAGTDTNAPITKENARYYGGIDDGRMYRDRWFKVSPFASASEYDEEYWYYAQGSGALVVGQSESINDERYYFDKDGHAITGFIVTDEDDKLSEEWTDAANRSFEEYMTIPAEYKIEYYPEREGLDGRGYRVNGKQTVTIWEDDVEIHFNGDNVKNGALPYTKPKLAYNNGFLLKAEPGMKCEIVKVNIGGYSVLYGQRHYYLVNEQGSIIQSRALPDCEGYYWAVDGNFEIYKCGDEYAAYAAKSLLKEPGDPDKGIFKVMNEKYECETAPVIEDGETVYYNVTWHLVTE